MLKFVLNFFMEIYYNILDIIFPPVCGICGKINKNWLCDNCEETLNRIKKNKIIKINKDKNYIKNRENKIFYDELLYIFEYKGLIRQIILKYKFNQKAYLFNFFSRIILEDKICVNKINSYDEIIPVPMSEKKKKQRGYNQTELITKEISKSLKINLQENILIKIKNTKMQSSLSKEERKENIRNAFWVNNIEKVKNKKIIIFDDIYTTGETVNEASKVLKKAGVKEILVLVIAKD